MEIFLEGQFIDSALDTFPTLAEYFSAAGQVDFAVKILAHGIENPVTEEFARWEAAEILERLLKDLGPGRGTKARIEGENQPFEILAAAINSNLV